MSQEHITIQALIQEKQELEQKLESLKKLSWKLITFKLDEWSDGDSMAYDLCFGCEQFVETTNFRSCNCNNPARYICLNCLHPKNSKNKKERLKECGLFEVGRELRCDNCK